MDSTELEPISLNLPCLKVLSAKWIIAAVDHVADNPQIVVHGFIRAGITALLGAEEVTSGKKSSKMVECINSETDSETDSEDNGLSDCPQGEESAVETDD